MRDPLRLLDRIANRWAREFPGPLLPITATRPIVSLTFDDVPVSALTNGAPVLEAHGVRGTFYASGGLPGRREDERTLMSAEDYAALAERGHEIGCHTFAHPRVARLSPGRLASDLESNARYLAGVPGGVVARNFAFPYGLAAPQARRTLARSFRSCRSGHHGINRSTIDRLYLRAVEIRRDTPFELLTAWIEDLIREPGWLILFTHDVAANPPLFGCTPHTLEGVITTAQRRDCSILTVDAALDTLGLATATEAVPCG
jgi:peptidoglycan/xylan/chitin deacetylase (PgdA/CDA1 family)